MIITNIFACITVALVTNVSERFPRHMVSDPLPPGNATLAIFSGHYVNDENPDRKWVRTTVTRCRSINGEFEGKVFSVTLSQEPVSDVEVECLVERIGKWNPVSTNKVEQVQCLTNSVLAESNAIYLGNLSITNGWFKGITNK